MSDVLAPEAPQEIAKSEKPEPKPAVQESTAEEKAAAVAEVNSIVQAVTTKQKEGDTKGALEAMAADDVGMAEQENAELRGNADVPFLAQQSQLQRGEIPAVSLQGGLPAGSESNAAMNEAYSRQLQESANKALTEAQQAVVAATQSVQQGEQLLQSLDVSEPVVNQPQPVRSSPLSPEVLPEAVGDASGVSSVLENPVQIGIDGTQAEEKPPVSTRDTESSAKIVTPVEPIIPGIAQTASFSEQAEAIRAAAGLSPVAEGAPPVSDNEPFPSQTRLNEPAGASIVDQAKPDVTVQSSVPANGGEPVLADAPSVAGKAVDLVGVQPLANRAKVREAIGMSQYARDQELERKLREKNQGNEAPELPVVATTEPEVPPTTAAQLAETEKPAASNLEAEIEADEAERTARNAETADALAQGKLAEGFSQQITDEIAVNNATQAVREANATVDSMNPAVVAEAPTLSTADRTEIPDIGVRENATKSGVTSEAVASTGSQNVSQAETSVGAVANAQEAAGSLPLSNVGAAPATSEAGLPLVDDPTKGHFPEVMAEARRLGRVDANGQIINEQTPEPAKQPGRLRRMFGGKGVSNQPDANSSEKTPEPKKKNVLRRMFGGKQQPEEPQPGAPWDDRELAMNDPRRLAAMESYAQRKGIDISQSASQTSQGFEQQNGDGKQVIQTGKSEQSRQAQTTPTAEKASQNEDSKKTPEKPELTPEMAQRQVMEGITALLKFQNIDTQSLNMNSMAELLSKLVQTQKEGPATPEQQKEKENLLLMMAFIILTMSAGAAVGIPKVVEKSIK